MVDPGAAVAAASEAMDAAYGAYTGPGWAPARFSPDHSHRGRYLWTDAFGVCNYCSLYLETCEERYLRQAEALAEAVHGTLGFTRDGSRRLGAATAEHPTLGGLRIGKPDEGGPDGDGIYWHYTTKWAYALLQLSAAADEPRYLVWGAELLDATFPCFLCLPSPGGGKRLSWKMSADLSRPLVASSGNLDALDALVTINLLANAASRVLGDDADAGPPEAGGGGDLGGRVGLVARLRRYASAAAALVAPWWRGFASDDPLDLGEALWLAHWYQTGAVPRTSAGSRDGGAEGLDLPRACDHVAAQALASLDALWAEGYFSLPPRRRLAFRELGATLGVQALISRVPQVPGAKQWAGRVEGLHAQWQGALCQRDADITPAMFAASLLPRVWLKG